jgi:hypothetical protein
MKFYGRCSNIPHKRWLKSIQFSYTEKMRTTATFSCQTMMCRRLWYSGFGSSPRNSLCKMFTHKYPQMSYSCTWHTFILNLLGICSQRHSYIIKYPPFIFNVIISYPFISCFDCTMQTQQQRS